MKNMKKIILFALVALAISVGACSKEETQVDLTKDVVGTYQGKLSNTSSNTQTTSTSTITYHNDYTIKVHCVSGSFDTTFLLELYPEGSMMKVCTTGDDFYKEYGYEKSNGNHMMDGSNMMNWGEHMNSDHSSNDEHYGGFDLGNNEFEYTFRMESDSNMYENIFVGKK